MTDRKRLALVVDDEALIRMTLCDMLAELGIQSIEAGNAADALALLEQSPETGMMITDLGLPGMSGEELVSRARDMRPALKIVVVTGRIPDAQSGHGERAGVVYLEKPFDFAGLRLALQSE